jgi:two-component system invasion response regulator UvrY
MVDDNPELLLVARRRLAADAYIEIVGEALSGSAAVDQVEALQPDLVLMDITMPGMNGLEATTRIKERPNAPHVLILTLHDGAEFRAAAKRAGADGFANKSEFESQVIALIYALFAIPDGPVRGINSSVCRHAEDHT